MGIIDIDNMFWEMQNTMKSNFDGTATQRYQKAKKLFLDTIADYIEQNKSELIKEVKKNI